MKVVQKNIVLADSNQTVVIEGNHYFLPESINWDYLQKSDTHTKCPWKGEASYYDVVIDGAVEKDTAWYYPEPKKAAKEIKNHVAFYSGAEE